MFRTAASSRKPQAANFLPALTALLTLLAPAAAQMPQPDSTERVVFTLLEQYGPVIDRAEATEVGLFKYRPNFGALRFVHAAGQYEARVATRVGGVMLEQAVPLDSPAMARVAQGLALLRDRGATNVELLLTPSGPPDISVLGPASDARAAAAAVCFGALGLGVGMVVGTELTFDQEQHEMGWTEWRKKNLAVTAAIAGATAMAGGFGGWHLGSSADGGRPSAPKPRCAIAGYDDSGFPFYEEQVRAVLGSQNTVLYTGGGIALGAIAAAIAGSIVNSHLSWMTSQNDPTGLGAAPVTVMDLSLVAGIVYLTNTVGRDLDRRIALDKLRHRPRW